MANELDKKIPLLAKDSHAIEAIREKVSQQQTLHQIIRTDARDLEFIDENSVHLILTSPPYFNLKRYNESDDQLGHIDDYETFLNELYGIWKQCFDKLIQGGRMIVVVGDVLLSRRQFGRHKILPLHADIQVQCEKIGFDNLAPIFWYKISNAQFEVKGNTKFLGKPYEPNGIIKHDIEYILMLRKPGAYRKPTLEQRELSIISETEFNTWYKQIWTVNGTSTRYHPAPFPVKLAEPLIRMFSFVDDLVFDPFLGSGTTTLAAMQAGRHSIGTEIDKEYAELAFSRANQNVGLFGSNSLTVIKKDLINEKLIAK